MHVNCYRIVGDNWDMEVKSRCQTTAKNNRSLHYFHMFAVTDRIYQENLSTKKPQKVIDAISMDEFLPVSAVQEEFLDDLHDIIPRILVRYVKAYKPLKKAVIYHISHSHTQEMNTKSEWVGSLSVFNFLLVLSAYTSDT